MDVERFLKEYPMLTEELIRLNNELNEVIRCKEDCYNTLRAQNLTSMPKDETPEDHPSTVENAVIRITDRYGAAVSYYTSRINDLLEQKQQFEMAWSDRALLTASERMIIMLRYIQDMPWSMVCRQSHYARSRASEIAQDGITKLQNRVIELVGKERTKSDIMVCYS